VRRSIGAAVLGRAGHSSKGGIARRLHDVNRTMMSMIVVAGEALIDRIVHADGTTIDHPGGGPFNTARTIARLGLPVGFLGSLSTDDAGAVLRDVLASDGVDLSLTASTDAPTTVAVASIDAGGSASYAFETAGTSATRLPFAAIHAALATRPEAFHLGTLGLVLEPLATALIDAVAGIAPQTLVMLDPNCRPSAIADRDAYVARLLRVARRADVVKASREDLDYLWPGMPTSVAAHRLLTAGPLAVVVTDGPRPVAWFTPEWRIDFDVPTVTVVDTIGAGDAFGGGLLARWIDGGRHRAQLLDEAAARDAVAVAIEVSAITCGRPGADPPRRGEVAWAR
jgi:fructokinase